MRDFSTPRTYILSAHKGTEQDARNHAELACDLALANAPFKEAEGFYDGKLEQCFVVVGARHGETVARLSREYGQDTYLVIAEHDRAAYLVDPKTGYHTHLGRFGSVDSVKDCDAWTLVGDTYFTTNGSKGPNLPEGF